MVRINSLPLAGSVDPTDSLALDTATGTRRLSVAGLAQTLDRLGASDLRSVKSFGALGDGTTDDTAAIQAAIDSVGAYGTGGAIFLPATNPSNTYMVSTLRLADRVRLVGEHRDVTLKKLPGSAGPVITQLNGKGDGANAAGFTNLTIDGNKTACPRGTDGIGQFAGGVRTGFRGDFAILENVIVKNCNRHGINIGDSSAGDNSPATYQVIMSNVWAHHCDGRGIVLDRVFDSYITNGWLNSNALGGALLRRCATVRWSDGQIEGFGISVGAARPGVELGEHNRWISFVGCTFVACRHGLHINGGAENVRISACAFAKNSDNANAQYDNVRVSPGSQTVNGLSITGNYFSADADNGKSAVNYNVKVDVSDDGGSVLGLVMSANIFDGLGGDVPVLGMMSMPTLVVNNATIGDNAGAPALPLGCYVRETDYSVPDSAERAVSWRHGVADAQTMLDSSGSSSQIVVPVSGVYRATASVDWAPNPFGDRSILIQLKRADGTTSTVAAWRGGVNSVGASAGTADSGGVMCEVGDNFSVQLFQSSGEELLARTVALSVATPR